MSPPWLRPGDVLPGSAVSLQLVRGDLEIAATCTVTYIDPQQLLACGHPVLQAGPISMPMTKAEIVTTLASSLQSFKIVNTGDTIGAFTEDRESAIRGVLGSRARMIPLHITVKGTQGTRKLNVEVLDQAPLTPQAVLVVLFQALLQNNESTAETSYHLTGSIEHGRLSARPSRSLGSGNRQHAGSHDGRARNRREVREVLLQQRPPRHHALH